MKPQDKELDEIIKNAMVGGFESSMGGSPFNSEEENKAICEKTYDDTMLETKQQLIAWRNKYAQEYADKIIDNIVEYRDQWALWIDTDNDKNYEQPTNAKVVASLDVFIEDQRKLNNELKGEM